VRRRNVWKTIGGFAGTFVAGVLFSVIFFRGGSDLSTELADAERRYQEAIATLERAEDGLQRIGDAIGETVGGLDRLDESIDRIADGIGRAVERAEESEERTRDLQGRVRELEVAVAAGASVAGGASARHREIEEIIGRLLSVGDPSDP
jgi:methyl-accepting chemotaxis protein